MAATACPPPGICSNGITRWASEAADSHLDNGRLLALTGCRTGGAARQGPHLSGRQRKPLRRPATHRAVTLAPPLHHPVGWCGTGLRISVLQVRPQRAGLVDKRPDSCSEHGGDNVFSLGAATPKVQSVRGWQESCPSGRRHHGRQTSVAARHQRYAPGSHQQTSSASTAPTSSDVEYKSLMRLHGRLRATS